MHVDGRRKKLRTSYEIEQTGTMTSSNVSKELSEEISVRYPCLYGTYDIHSTTYLLRFEATTCSLCIKAGRPAGGLPKPRNTKIS